MTWSAGVDRTTGALISSPDWNKYLGVTGSLMETATAKVTTAGDIVYATGANALARLAAVGVGQVLTSQGVGVAPVWGNGPEPWRVEINPLFYETFVGTWTRTNSAAVLTYAVLQNPATAALNDEVTFTVVLSAGTWTCRVAYFKGTDQGIMSHQLDGVQVGTIDSYFGSATVDNITDITGVAVAASGKKTYKIKMTAKNASSSAYAARVQYVVWLRTA